MRLSGILVLASVSVFGLAMPASADARSDTLKLHQAIVSSMNAYIALSEKSDITPAFGLRQLEETVKRPVEKAQMNWWNALHASADDSTYNPFMMCNSAAQSIQDLADDMIKFLEGDGAKSPASDQSENYLASDITECEVSLGIKPTFAE